MTLPLERSRSIMHARQFLLDLMDSKKTPKVPKKIRTRAYQVLRHFPTEYDVNHAADGAPERFDHLEELENAFIKRFVEENEYMIDKGRKKKKKKTDRKP